MSDDITLLARPEIVALKAYESARSLVTGGASIFLDANESPVGERGLNRYPEPQPRELLNRFAELYGVSRERIVVGRGSDEAIDLLVRLFCRSGKDAVLICPPTYGMYEVAAEMQGAEIVRVPMLGGSRSEPTLDERGISESLRSGEVKIVFLCSPNNPTGTAFESDILQRITLAARGRAIVVIDEAYAEFSNERSMLEHLDAFPNLVVLRTLSKAWALAGARCGVAVGSPLLTSLLHKLRAPYPLSLPAIEAALVGTNEDGRQTLRDRVQVLRDMRDQLARDLSRLRGVTQVFASSANFLLVRFRDSALVMSAAREAGIILRDRGREPSLAGCVRITVGTPRENEALLLALRAAGV